MMRNKYRLSAVCSALICCHAHATGGFHVTTQSARGTAMADAMVAQVDDASAGYYNPAGLAKVKGTQLIGGFLMANQSSWQFDGDVRNPYTGEWQESHDDAQKKVPMAPHLYFAHNFGNNFVAGVALNASYPMSINWTQGENISFYNVECNLLPITLNPNFAYMFEEIGLSIGFGFSYTYTQLSTEDMVGEGKLGEGSPLASVRTDLHDGEWGYDLGVMWDINDRLTLGASYRAEIEHEYHGDIDIAVPAETPQGPAWVNLPKMKTPGGGIKNSLPAAIWVGVAYDFTDRLTMEFDVIKTELSTFSSKYGKWDDIYGVKIGAEYKLNSKWVLRGGYAYDQDAVPNRVKSNDTQIGEHHFISAGAGYTGQEFKFDIALAESIFSSNDVDNDRLNGTFQNHVDLVQVSFTYDF